MSDPNAIPVSMLTADELADLEARGMVKNGMATPLVQPPAGPKADAAPTELPRDAVPAMPTGVAERLAAAKQVQSSFALKEGDTVKAASTDGGKQAEQAVASTPDANPDFPGKSPEPVIDFADRAAFLAHMLGAPRFTKKYELFGGKLSVVLQTVTALEERRCADQARLDDKIEGPGGPAGSQEAIATQLQRYANYRFAASIARIELEGQLARDQAPFELGENLAAHETSIRRAYANYLKLPAPLLLLLRRQLTAFDNLVARLTLDAEKPDFWRAASGT